MHCKSKIRKRKLPSFGISWC